MLSLHAAQPGSSRVNRGRSWRDCASEVVYLSSIVTAAFTPQKSVIGGPIFERSSPASGGGGSQIFEQPPRIFDALSAAAVAPARAAAAVGLFKNQRPPEGGDDRLKIDSPITLFWGVNAALHILLMSTRKTTTFKQ